MELRCPSRIHAVIEDDNVIKFQCRSKRCGAGNGTIVFHYYNLSSGDFLQTRKFQDPTKLFNGSATQERTD